MFSLAGTLLLILAGLATVLAFVKAYPTRPAIAAGPTVIDAQIRELSPVETLQLWENMVRSGVRRPTMLSERKYDEAMSHFYLWLALCGVLAFAGAGVLAQGRWLAVQQKRAAGSTPR